MKTNIKTADVLADQGAPGKTMENLYKATSIMLQLTKEERLEFLLFLKSLKGE